MQQIKMKYIFIRFIKISRQYLIVEYLQDKLLIILQKQRNKDVIINYNAH